MNFFGLVEITVMDIPLAHQILVQLERFGNVSSGCKDVDSSIDILRFKPVAIQNNSCNTSGSDEVRNSYLFCGIMAVKRKTSMVEKERLPR